MIRFFDRVMLAACLLGALGLVLLYGLVTLFVTIPAAIYFALKYGLIDRLESEGRITVVTNPIFEGNRYRRTAILGHEWHENFTDPTFPMPTEEYVRVLGPVPPPRKGLVRFQRGPHERREVRGRPKRGLSRFER